ncbi:hypothetical protein [Sphingobacterium haloxyli]|uniref:DUF5689 domain-containing protein n=1 Tax=Sphingobacterium haloxyli TaxID=2100533 RepID=A0A2S9J4U7_9SPHI|nr:hypothetical protein [Sphingobacterium haloxyli]PRD47780.1 hypothetical protein C5745_07645 [Sphingobacterium haloxyli]
MKAIRKKLRTNWFVSVIFGCCIFTGCNKIEPTVAPQEETHSLSTIRELSAGTIPDGIKITAVVISNPLIEDTDLVYVQDEEGSAVKLRFAGGHNFNLGDRIEVYLSGCKLEVNGSEYEVKEIPLIFSNRIGSVALVPRITTAEEIKASREQWTSSLLRLRAMKVISGPDDGLYLLQDSIGESTIHVSVEESLELPLPDSVQFISGYLFYINGFPALRLRNASDIVTYSRQVGDQTILEPFDFGGTGSMPNGDQVFTGFVSGDWMFNDAAVLGANEVNDLRNGTGTVRLRGNLTNARVGYIYTLFDVQGLQKIRFNFGGTNLGEGGAEVNEYAVEAFVSTDAGSTWISLGKKVGTRGSFTVMEYEVNGDADKNYRVKIQNRSFVRTDNGNRLRANVDDVELIY